MPVTFVIGRAGSGSLVVLGAGSEVTANGYLYVGRAEGGLLAVESQAIVNAGSVGSGAAIGDGNGTLASLTGGLGVLELTTGGTFADSGTLVIGGNGASGLASVDDSLLEATAQIFLGVGSTISGQYYTGTGTLEISDAGTVELAGTAHTGTGIGVGNAAGSNGLVTVTGTASLLNAENNLLDIGNASTGTVMVSQGGSVFAASPGPGYAAIVLGNTPTGAGTLSVDGASSVTAQGALTVGFAGTGTVAITNGASVASIVKR